MAISVNLLYRERGWEMQLGKQQHGLILAARGAVWYFWGGAVALFLSIFRQNYEVPLLCLTVLWSKSNLI